jgi:hypothetical protein
MVVSDTAPAFPISTPSIGQTTTPPPAEDDQPSSGVLWGFALANIGAIAFGIGADYLIKEKTDTSRRIVTGATVAVSLIAIGFSFRLVTLPMNLSINPFWRVLGGFMTYMNTVVGLRAGFDFFKEVPEMPTLHKFAREILKV